MGIIWPEIFRDPGLIEEMEPVDFCADMLVAWGNIMAGDKIPSNFVDVMARGSDRLGAPAAPASLINLAKARGWMKSEGVDQ